MPNKQYEKGVRKERKIMNEARKRGLIAFRSAGSHSPIDVCVINPKLKEISFIQCKPDKITFNEKQRLENDMRELSGLFKVYFSVI